MDFKRLIEGMKQREAQEENPNPQPKQEVFNPDWNVLGKKARYGEDFDSQPEIWGRFLASGALDEWLENKRNREVKQWRDEGEEDIAKDREGMDNETYLKYLKRNNLLKDDRALTNWLLDKADIDWAKFAKYDHKNIPHEDLRELYEEEHPEWFK